ncbi:acylphosphatase [Janthinobacterium sp. HH01]|uniref:acylphosphatase n=1 Tax=Janthinobacterium sp. HH01 TaxID=1198452 RepID=UPI0002AECE75|nr:acylphosphatase [Janthinobacterium sp. HH01]ELX13087.1 acylphosphatase [Janthinobacterium sp. HH01]
MIRLLVAGRVQGVGYRAAFAERARALGLSGWVRNRQDGSVEAVVDGEAHAVEAITAWARRGPPAAVVSSVTVDDGPALEAVAGDFKILPTL